MRQMMRIDVLIWNWRDSRHDIIGIDRTANFQRLYYQLVKHVFRDRWETGSVWHFFPDEQGELDWDSVEGYLGQVEQSLEFDPGLLGMGPFGLRLKTDFRISGITECDSAEEPLIQLADLFAGIATYSRSNYDKISYYRNAKLDNGQMSLPGLEPDEIALSPRDREHSHVILELNRQCKKQRLGVSLQQRQGLWTPDPKNPINFWWYEPQHDFDKAPTRH
jgi:hypothetical protein